jgi:hypothetical protein
VFHRGPLARVLIWMAAGAAGFLGVVGGLALRGPGLVAVGVGGVLAAGTAAGIARESPAPRRRSTVECAAQAASWTVGAILVLAGIATLAGPVPAVLCVGATVAVLLVRFGRSLPVAGAATPGQPSGVLRFPVDQPRPVRRAAIRSTADLCQEWTRTARALTGRLDPRARATLVQRREELLDELERRDPAGFARWLAAGPDLGSDPADYVRGGPLLGGPAETDAA